MEHFASLPVGAAGMLAAVLLVGAGAPLFASGLRARRLRHALEGAAPAPLDASANGLVVASGRVALEGPMFAPLSGRPCAGFTLEVKGVGMRVGGEVHELRAFRLVHEHVSARVLPEGACWRGRVTCERSWTAAEPVPERLGELLGRSPETRWLRDRRVPLALVERALEVGSVVCVTGMARMARAAEAVEEQELAATGTDGPAYAAGMRGAAAEPGLWIEPAEPLGRVLVTPEPPPLASLAPPAWRLALLALGPALTCAGLLYLARAAGPLVAGRF